MSILITISLLSEKEGFVDQICAGSGGGESYSRFSDYISREKMLIWDILQGI